LEYFIRAASFAAPFVSDESTDYVEADTPEEALLAFVERYKHPMGLYSADAYASADAYYKDQPRLARWLCNKQRVLDEATSGKSAYSVYSPSADAVEVDGERIEIQDPKGGGIV
jgi:hypothetical protein